MCKTSGGSWISRKRGFILPGARLFACVRSSFLRCDDSDRRLFLNSHCGSWRGQRIDAGEFFVSSSKRSAKNVTGSFYRGNMFSLSTSGWHCEPGPMVHGHLPRLLWNPLPFAKQRSMKHSEELLADNLPATWVHHTAQRQVTVWASLFVKTCDWISLAQLPVWPTFNLYESQWRNRMCFTIPT